MEILWKYGLQSQVVVLVENSKTMVRNFFFNLIGIEQFSKININKYIVIYIYIYMLQVKIIIIFRLFYDF